MFAKKGLSAAPAAVPVYVEDVFSTYLYTGTGSAQTITNNIDLSGEGGLVWIKSRSNGLLNNVLMDTARGVYQTLRSDLTADQSNESSVTAFNSNGFTLGTFSRVSNSSDTFVSWSFRKAEKFFDVVTWTGTGSPQNISHNLGSTPGCIMIKSTSISGNWWVWHRSLPDARYGLYLNGTAAQTASDTTLDWTDPTSTNFRVGTSALTNSNGATYVAYLFAHDAGGFGDDGDQSVVKCGSYTGNGSTTGPTIDLGWEPQWVLIKQSTNAGTRWTITDNMRGFPVTSAAQQQILQPNVTDAEVGVMYIQPTSTGFKVVDVDADVNQSGGTYVYIAIRRGPMKTPEAGTSVFDVDTYTGDGGVSRLISSGFATDFSLIRDRNDGTESYRQNFVQDRLRGGGRSLVTNSTGAEGADTGWTNSDMVNQFQSNTGILVTVTSSRYNASSKSYVAYQFARAPGFMDVVCYSGTGSNTTISHNLGVAPELIFVKSRNGTRNWAVYNSTIGNTKYLLLNSPAIPSTSSTYWNNTSPTSSVFTVGTALPVNASGENYVAYLFASLSGVSKVGTYTGNGTNQNINCGFTAGARFVLIRNYSDGGDWTLFDTARGIVSGNDPFITLNDPNTEITTSDSVDPVSSGFNVVQNGTSNLNVSSQTYIYLAIA